VENFIKKYRNQYKIKCYDKGFKTVGLSASLSLINPFGIKEKPASPKQNFQASWFFSFL